MCTVHLIVRMIKSRRLRWVGHVARMEDGWNAFNILTGTPAEKSPLGRPRHRWEGNIRMQFKELGINTRNWVIRLRIRLIGGPL